MSPLRWLLSKAKLPRGGGRGAFCFREFSEDVFKLPNKIPDDQEGPRSVSDHNKALAYLRLRKQLRVRVLTLVLFAAGYGLGAFHAMRMKGFSWHK